MKMQFCFGLAVLGLLQFSAMASTSYDKLPVPKKGGNMNVTISINPANLSPILESDLESRRVAGNFYLPLFDTDLANYNPFPSLAEKVEISKDKKDYTYTLNSKAIWSDGTAVTSDDVVYSFERMMDPKVNAAAIRGYFDGIVLTKIDDHKFKFHVDQPPYNILTTLNGFQPFQKKQFVNEPDFNKSKEHLRPVGTGPYIVKSFSRDQAMVLERLPNWWAKDLPQYRAKFNQDTLTYKIISDPALEYEKFIKGDIDLVNFTSDQYVNQVKKGDADKIGASPKDGKKVWGNKLPTDGPMGWFGIALNTKVPMLSSKLTRQGLAYLVDYQTIIDRAFFGQIEQSVSPFGSNTENSDPGLRAKKGLYTFNPTKSAELFAKDGWKKEPGQPFLMKMIDGTNTPFHILLKFGTGNPAVSKISVILKEIFKKSGVDLELRAMDGTSLYKDFEEKQFEALVMGWGGGDLAPDPKQLWATESIPHGSNYVSFSNAKADELIKKADLEFNRKKREKIMQQINRIIYEEVPYIFVAERHFILQGINSRFKSPMWIERFGDQPAKELFHE
jgi:microcin C transport system substrate-binding protein